MIIKTIKNIGKATKEINEKADESDMESSKQVSKKMEKVFGKDIKELVDKSIEQNVGGSIVNKLDDIKNLTYEQLQEKMERNMNRIREYSEEYKEGTDVSREEAKDGLTDEQKEKLKDEKDWSCDIINNIGSWEEYEIYKNANLIETEMGNKKCLIRNDIDWNQKDAMERTNKERAEQGLSPINKNGKVIELHHIGQHADSPLAELTQEEHRGKGNDTILHNKTKESEIDRYAFARERSEHWLARV